MKSLVILLVVALVVSSIGWKKFIYFISIGYGFSIAACAIAIAIIYRHSITVSTVLLCAILYVAEISPVAFMLDNKTAGAPVNDLWAWIGAAVMILGVCLETAADAQKSAAKKVNPKTFVSTGLYRIVRCPNYFGEMVTWTGCLLVCFGACCNIWQWILAIVGYLGIVYIMFSGARRLEIRQNRNYGSGGDYDHRPIFWSRAAAFSAFQ